MKNFLLLLLSALCLTAHIYGQPKPKPRPTATPFEIPDPDDPKPHFIKPSPLPQSPVPHRPSTDARDQGLKGKVKTVFYDIQEAGKAREPSSLEYYGPDGNLTLGISYTLDGDDLAFGYLDGYRVSKEVLETPGKRYTNRYEYRYDDKGRLVEEKTFNEDGTFGSRTLYLYRPGETEEQVFGDDVVVLIRKVSILDDKGDTKEQRAYEPELPDPFDVEIWTHEYDAMGNWIVERNYAPAKKGSKLPGKLLRTYRRTITYYP